MCTNSNAANEIMTSNFMDTFPAFSGLCPSCMVAGMTDDFPSSRLPVQALARYQPSNFKVSLASVFPFVSVILSSFYVLYAFSILSPVCVLHLSSSNAFSLPVQSSLGDILESCATVVVLRMYLFLILALLATPHIHHSSLFSFTSNLRNQRYFIYALSPIYKTNYLPHA